MNIIPDDPPGTVEKENMEKLLREERCLPMVQPDAGISHVKLFSEMIALPQITKSDIDNTMLQPSGHTPHTSWKDNSDSHFLSLIAGGLS